MSRTFKPKNKDLVNLEVVTADKIWVKNNKGKMMLNRKEYDIYGRVDKSSDCFVTNTNLQGKNHKFIENTSSLNNVTKNKIVDNFFNKNKRVVYLVKKKNKEKK